MARHGENIRKRKDGRWEGRFLVLNREKGRKTYCSVYANSYEEVKKKLCAKKEQLEKGFPDEAENYPAAKDAPITFGMAASEWMAEIRSGCKLSTYSKYKAVYCKHLAPVLDDCPVSDVSDVLLREKISDPLLSESMQKSIYSMIGRILLFVSHKYRIPVQAVKRPAVKARRSPAGVFDRAQQRILFASLYTCMDLYKMAVALCLYTGVRIGELCALKWSDIDFENKLIYVNRTVQRLPADCGNTKTALVESEPKSVCSKREIPMSVPVLEMFMKFRNDKPYVFGGDKPLEPRKMQYHYKKIMKEAGLPYRNFHSLRHTFATNCIEGGMDVKSLSEILGHSDVKITLSRYVHPSADTKRKHMECLSRFYGQFRGQAV